MKAIVYELYGSPELREIEQPDVGTDFAGRIEAVGSRVTQF